MINRGSEVDLSEAIDMTDLSEEDLGRLAEAGKLKARRANGAVYFLREEIEALIDRQIEEVRSEDRL